MVERVETGVEAVEAQEKSMARLAEILRENGVDVFQWEPCGYEDCGYQERPKLWFGGDDNEGERAVEIGLKHDFPTIRISQQWVVDEDGIVEESRCWAMTFPYLDRLSACATPKYSQGKPSIRAHRE